MVETETASATSSQTRSASNSTQEIGTYMKLISHGDIGVIEWDLQGEKVNKLSTPVMRAFDQLLKDLRTSNFKAIVMLSRKPRIFIAGADIEEIKGIRQRDEATKASAQGQAIFNLIEDLPIPVIAAVNGACMGGGTEMILACDYRLCSDDKSTKIGLPETQLGIIPGFGGCVRMPRVIGLQAALDLILAGKAVDGKKAEKLGLVDQCVPAALLEERAMAKAREVIQSGAKKRRKTFEPKNLQQRLLDGILKPVVFQQARKQVMKTTGGHYPAVLKALEVIQKTYGLSNRQRALEIEAEGFGEVAITDVSKNLIHIFYMTEAIKKQNGLPAGTTVKPMEVKHLGVLGAGTMGGGIAQLAADKGIDVRLKDVNNDAIAKGFQHAESLWRKQLERRKIDKYQYKQRMDRLSGGTSYDGFPLLDLVIEAIVEDMGIKKKVIAEMAGHLKSECIVATNTSSLSVTEMATAMPRPEKFVGMHFFNPVHKMPLVEVIRGEKTGDEATTTIFELSKRLGKIPVVVKDGPGFLVNRLLLPYLNEAVYLLSEGLSVEEIDKAYVKFGMPMGPLHLIDEIGIDVAVKVAKIFHKAFGARAEPSPLMSKVVDSGRLGKKNGKGFYFYDEKGKKGDVDQAIYGVLGLSTPTGSSKVKTEDIVPRGIYAMINEAALALIEDRIVETPQEVDLAMIMGTGFPPFRGGLLKYADSVGTEAIVTALDEYAVKVGPRFKPSSPLVTMSKTNRKFYS